MTKVSNSQIMSLQTCERRFYYEHILKIKPREFPVNVRRGIFGHELAECFFKAMQAGLSYEECVDSMQLLIMDNLTDAELLKAYRLVCAFGAYAFQAGWKIIQVEENSLLEVEANEFAYTPDLIIEWTKGPKRGNRGILDFKFTGQYWTDKEIRVYQQLPKYMIYHNKVNKTKVTNCALIMLNTRASADATGEKLFLIKWVPVGKAKLQEIERENEILIERVAHVKATYKPEDYMRTVSNFTCKFCFFSEDICPMELEGLDVSKVLKHNYEINTYFDDNYNKE